MRILSALLLSLSMFTATAVSQPPPLPPPDPNAAALAAITLLWAADATHTFLDVETELDRRNKAATPLAKDTNKYWTVVTVRQGKSYTNGQNWFLSKGAAGKQVACTQLYPLNSPAIENRYTAYKDMAVLMLVTDVEGSYAEEAGSGTGTPYITFRVIEFISVNEFFAWVTTLLVGITLPDWLMVGPTPLDPTTNPATPQLPPVPTPLPPPSPPE